jgi:hypothetical protein
MTGEYFHRKENGDKEEVPRLSFTVNMTKNNIPEFFKNIFVGLESSFSDAPQFFYSCRRYSVDCNLIRPNNNRSTPVTSLLHPPAKPKLVKKLDNKTGPMIFLHMLKTKEAKITF